MTRHIRSSNAEYQVLSALRTNRQKRNRENAFLVEGVRNIDAALAHGWSVRSVITKPGKRSAWADGMCARVGDVVELSAELFASLTDRTDLPELVLVVEKRTVNLDDLSLGDGFVLTVLDRPSYPGNIGTIARTCDALGGAALCTIGHGADPYDPQSVRASTGSFFALPVAEADNAEQLARWAAARGVRLVATDEGGDTSLDALPAPPLALLMGNETKGLSRGLREVADATVSIPMRGTASSLNVAAAHAIVLHAATKS
jgi:23S rRNA (uridine2479-2'-O)-methyltransferase